MMIVVEKGQLAGEFHGFKDETTTFTFYAGNRWRQSRYYYHYHYAYMPRAQVVLEGGRQVLYVDGIDGGIDVERVI